MGALSTVLLPDPLRSIDSATFTGDYQAVGTPLSNGARIIKFMNVTSVDVTLSWDGVTDNEFLPPNSFVLLDVSGNRENSQYLEVKMGTQFYVKGASGSGNFYISCYYGK
jgi:hypothetical protein